MAYSTSILPRSAAYYTLSNASIVNSEMLLDAGGSAEIQISSQMLPKLTARMLVVVHPSQFSSSYTNDAVQVTISIVTLSGEHIEYLIPIAYSASGVFNTVIELPEEPFALFTYKISSKVALSVYNWELCAEEAVDVTTVIDGVEQALPRLLYDYNTYSYAVAQKELTVGLISCYLRAPTDLQGHFTLSFFATERCNVHVRIKDNGVTELFSPQVYTVEKGHASISIPHAYLQKTASDHAFSVTLQCTNGQLSLPVRGLLYTIDGGYLATRLLDAGIDVEDLSIKQLSTDSTPSEIWAIGFEGNRLILKSRAYSSAQSADWAAIKDFGEGLKASVEFRGTWLLRSGADKYTLETEERPYVFIVEPDGTLRVYYGDTFNVSEALDTNVSSVSACQGFSSMYYTEQDQGLVVAYVKNGNVYYRSFTYNSSSSAYGWDAANVVYSGGDASFVNVHRLPDYRLGICVQHASGSKWYITDRTYVGQAVKPEAINSYLDCNMLTTVIDSGMEQESVLWTASQNVFSGADTYHNGFVMTFDGVLHFLRDFSINDLKESLVVSISGTTLSPEGIKSITLTDDTISVELVNSVRGGSTVTIYYNCYPLVLIIYNGCYASIKQEYSWSLPLPTTQVTATESLASSISGALTAVVRPTVPNTKSTSEDLQVDLSTTLTAAVHKVSPVTLPVDEGVDVPVTGTVTLSVLQTGISPV